MSGDQAFRRIQVARAALELPDVFECLADGRLSIATASVLAPHLTAETGTEVLAASSFKSRDEIIRLIAERSRSTVRAQASPAVEPHEESSSGSLAPGQVKELPDRCVPAAGAAATSAPALIYARAMKHYLAHLVKKRLGAKPGAVVPASSGRGIPKSVYRLVWERDGGKCAFVSADGHRCDATRRLEIDHIQPLALGGATTPDNLRLLCRPHNQFEAERVLGKDHVAKKREFARRERARAKAATKAESARAKEREERRDDITSALRGLGFTVVEARRGAKLSDSLPEASLETCVRHALTALTRSVKMRGERRARCTA
jgi:hypothetical protein